MMAAEGQPPDADIAALLREGMAAARAGERERARELLTGVVQRDDRNAIAWLWLSGVVDDLNNRESCLQTALQIDPQNEAAQRGLAQVRRQKLDELLRAGIAAAQRGQSDHARALLTRVVEQDERNVAAWLWLSGVVPRLEDRETALENALTLDPENEAARRGLAEVRDQMALEATTRAEMAPRVAPEREGPVPSPVTVDVDWSRPSAPADEFDNEMLCPSCAAPTAYEDKSCRSCGHSLVLKRRRREERSSFLWVAITLQVLQVASAVISVFSLLVGLGWTLREAGVVMAPSLGSSLQVLLQIGRPAPAGLGAFLLYIRLAFILAFVELLFQTVVLIGLYMRWKPFWYLFLASTALSLLLAVATMLLTKSLLCGGAMVLLSLALVGLAFQIQDDFFFDYTRILLRPDRGARSATDYLVRARDYARRRMWAAAIVHYRRATAGLSGLAEPHLGLALGYIQLRRFDRATAALDEARRIDPDNPHIADLMAMLEKAS